MKSFRVYGRSVLGFSRVGTPTRRVLFPSQWFEYQAKKRGSGQVVMNGGAAHKIKKGEEVIIIAFEFTDQPIQPRFILVDKDNKFVRYL